MKTHILPAMFAGLAGMSAAWAELLIDEPFDYFSGPVHDTPSSATGLSGNWVVGGHGSVNTSTNVNFLFESLEFENHFPSEGTGALELRNAGQGNWGLLGASIFLDESLDPGSLSVLWTSSIMRISSPGNDYHPDWRVEHRLNTSADAGLNTSALRVMARDEGSSNGGDTVNTTSIAAVGADHQVVREGVLGNAPIQPGVNYLYVTRSTIVAGAITGITLYTFDEAAYGSYLVAAIGNPGNAEALLATHALFTLTDSDVSTGTNTLTNKTALQFGISGGPIGAFDAIRAGTEIGDVVNLDATPAFDLELHSATLNFTQATIVIHDLETAVVDDTGEFLVFLDSAEVESFGVNKTDGVTTITIPVEVEANTSYFVYLSVPREGESFQEFYIDLASHHIPLDLPGDSGSVGSWAIREYFNPPPPPEPEDPENPDPPLPPANSILAAIDLIRNAVESEYVEGNAPVLNHSDPDTNFAHNSGNFNNDLPVLSNTAGNNDWVVTAKTKLNIPAAGVYTFAVHSDDGFALRISGNTGGRFISAHGTGAIDPADDQTIFLDGGSGDSNTRGVYQFDDAGVYDVTYLGWDGGGGGFHELAWAQGTFPASRDTNTWTLVGDPTHPDVLAIPFRPRYVTEIPGPPATPGNFSIRTYLQANDIGNTSQASDFVRNTIRQPGDGITFDVFRPTLNANDPQNGGGGGAVTPDEPFPGNTPEEDDNVVTVAKGRIIIPATQTYTFWVQSDDGFMLRIKGADGTPNPSFQRVTQGSGAADGTFQMSNPHEMYFEGGTGNADTRGIIELQAGSYDIDFIHREGGGGFYYELTAATGAWPHGSGTPPEGWLLVGYTAPVDQLEFPGIAEPGWTVESSLPDRPEDAHLGFNIAGAEVRINTTLALDPQPAGAVTTWDYLDFYDPQNGSQGSFPNSNPWPLDTPADDHNYAMRATGTLVITDPGDYHLGFQGDDGGYMQIDGPLEGGSPVAWSSIVATNHPGDAVLVEGSTNPGVPNRIQVQVGTGNSRTIGAINLPAGTYTIKTLVYEGTGGSWWEVIGSKASPNASVVYPLLRKGDGGIVHYPSGIQLIDRPEVEQPPGDGDFKITSPVLTIGANGVEAVSFSFGSEEGKSYTIWGSDDLENWLELTTIVATGDSTPVFLPLGEYEGSPKLFFRVSDP